MGRCRRSIVRDIEKLYEEQHSFMNNLSGPMLNTVYGMGIRCIKLKGATIRRELSTIEANERYLGLHDAFQDLKRDVEQNNQN